MNEFTVGWKVVLASMLGMAFCAVNIQLYAIGTIAPELSDEFGWSQGAIQLTSLLSIMALIISLPLATYLTGKYGARKVPLVSFITSSLMVAGHSFLPSNIYIFYALAVTTAITFSGVIPVTWTKMVILWFDKRLGLALGLTLLGTGFGGAVIKFLTASLIAEFGWRGAFLGLGALPMIAVLPFLFLWFRAPAQSLDQGVGEASLPKVDHQELPRKKFISDWRFWILAGAYLPIGVAVPGLITNMELIPNDLDAYSSPCCPLPALSFCQRP